MINHLVIQSNVFFCLILTLILVSIVYLVIQKFGVLEPFLSKRELRKNIYGDYSDDPDADMNNDNQLQRYLDI